MARWRITLFGTPRVNHDGETIRIGRRKATALLAYLIIRGKPQARDSLLTLLWPEFDRASAQNNLRRELALLRKLIGDGLLQSDRKDVWINDSADLWVDLWRFDELVAPSNLPNKTFSENDILGLEEGIELATAELLAGFSLPDAAAFNEWLFFEREEAQQKLLSALSAVTVNRSAAHDFETAIQYAKRRVTLDPLTEQNHRDLMRFFASANQTTAALRQYEQCVALFQEELGIEPEAETLALYESIRTRQIKPEAPPTPILKVKPAKPPQRPSLTLPKRSGPFVGREKEISSIEQLLTSEPDCRLLTLIGSGGIGKTSLAIELAPRLIDAYPDGIFFVPLADERNSAGLPSRIIDALNIREQPGDTRVQLVNHLQKARTLLILDNLDHLLGAVDLLDYLLKRCERLRFLVTCRETLGLSQEWLFPIGGLPLPQPDQVESHVAGNASVQLFVKAARQASTSFELMTSDQPAVVDICQMVDGVPLAIKLAAAWVHVMPCAEIAAEIKTGYEILETSLRNVPERHRSMQAVFEQTWQTLSAREQSALSRLSVFQGGFSKEAAREVAKASLPVLSALATKSVCHFDGVYYNIHPLLRQFVVDRLEKEEAQKIRQAHGRYFGRLMADHRSHILSKEEDRILKSVEAEYANITAACRFLLTEPVEPQLIDLLLDYIAVLAVYFERRSHYWDGDQLLSESLETVERRYVEDEAIKLIGNQLQIEIANNQINLTNYRLAEEMMSILLPTLRAGEHQRQLAACLTCLGKACLHIPAYEASERYSNEAIRVYEGLGLTLESTKPKANLGILLAYLGRYREAIESDGQTLKIYQEVGYRYGMSRMLNNQGYSLSKIWPTDPKVEASYRQAYALFDEFEDAYMMGITLVHLGEAAEAHGRHAEAIDWLTQAVEIFRRTKHMRWFVIALTALGYSQILLGDYEGAAAHLDEALDVGQQFQLVNDSKRVMASAAALFSRRENVELAAVTAYHLLNDPTIYAEVSTLCDTLISEISRDLESLNLKEAQTKGETISFGALQTLVGSELSAANL